MRSKIGVAAIAAALLLTGCTSAPDLSRLQNDMESEYIAGTILKYSANYDEMLDYDRSILNATPTPSPTPSPAAVSDEDKTENVTPSADGQNPIDAAPAYISVDELMPVDGITLTQETYEVRQSYGSDFATVDAEKGNKLLVVKFRIKNTTSSKKKVELNGLSYSLEVDGQATGRCLQLIMGDIQNFSERIPAGQSRESVLVFEVSKSQKIENSKLYISKGTQTAEVSLK